MTVRRAGAPAEHREITVAQLPDLLQELTVALTADELARLWERIAEL